MICEKEKRFVVMFPSYGSFRKNDIVVALETDSVPYCVKEIFFQKGVSVEEYLKKKIEVHAMRWQELIEIEEGGGR